jgi:hypothetical protein
MKKLIPLLVFILQSFFANAQIVDVNFKKLKIPVVDAVITYSLTDTISGSSKLDLHSGLREWVAKNFKSANAVIQMDDKEAGKIIVKGLHKQFYMFRYLGSDVPINYNLNFTIDFTIKEERYRAKLYNFLIEPTYSKIHPSAPVPTIDSQLEKVYWSTPNEYNFDKLSRREKIEIVTKRTVLMNADITANTLISSIRQFMRTESGNPKKEADF